MQEDMHPGSPHHEPPGPEQAAPPVTPGPPAYDPGGMMPAKPGQVMAIAILCVISGVLDCIGVFTVLACWPVGIYSLIVGILEIVYATKILPDPIRTSRMDRTLAILQIINILNCSVLAPVTGILSLVFYSDQKVQRYFDEMAVRGVY